ncbi:MAG: GntR family transcriptional regulator [Christensenellaceae bacterium]
MSAKQLPEQFEGNKQEYAYEYIKHAIQTHVYKPLQQVNETQLSEDLGCMSRTPIRDAIKRLACEGYVELRKNGITITDVTIEDTMEISEVRMWLESGTVRLFVERASDSDIQSLGQLLDAHKKAVESKDFALAEELDAQFHMVIARDSKNRHAAALLRQLVDKYERGSYSLPYDEEHFNTVIGQHTDIFLAIEARDADRAAQCMVHNLNTCVTHLKEMKINKYYLFKD